MSDESEKAIYWRPSEELPTLRPEDAIPGEELEREEQGPIERFELTIDPAQKQIRITGKLVHTTQIEFAILKLLASRPYWAFSRRRIVVAVAEAGHTLAEESVDEQIASLRGKLGYFSDYVQSVPGIGFRFKE